MRFTTSFALFAVALGMAGCVQPQQSTRQRGPAPLLVDEYSVLDDQHRGTPLSDQQIQKKLEEARRHYLMAMRSSDRGNQTLASRHFEAAIAILNDLITYPDIYSNPEFSKLSESLIRDYEEQVTSIDSLDPDGSFFVLRDKMMQEIETIPVAGRRNPGRNGAKATRTTAIDVTIEMSDNTPVDQSISFFTTEKGRKIFSSWLARSGRWFPMYEEILAEEGAPLELRHLSMIESGLKPTAVSWASAVGLWQFIPGTGRQYGLRIDWWVDERRDPVKATRAAARYLTDLYKEMGDWHLALASYNCGPGRVRSAIKKAGSRDYWKVRQFLPRETQQYVPLFIAASKITMDPEAYGFTDIQYEDPESYQTQSIPGSFDLAVLARVGETTVDELKALNPELLRDRTPEVPGGYQLKLPASAPRDMATLLDAIEVPAESQSIWITHRVGKGESFTGIAKKYNVTVAEIYEANSLSPKSTLKSGMSLKIPVDPASTADDTATLASNDQDDDRPTVERPAASAPVVTPPAPVVSQPAPVAQTPPSSAPVDIFADAPPVGTPVSTPASTPAANTQPVETPAPIVESSPRRETGSAPRSTPAPPPVVSEPRRETRNTETKSSRREEAPRNANRTHIVKRGETLTGIAEQYGVSVSDLAGWNKLARNAEVLRGQKLKITPGVRVTETPALSSNKSRRPVTTTTSRYETHKVRSGQSLIAIAEQYNVSVEDIKAWNPKGVRGNNVMAGAKLKIYSEAPSKGDARRNSRASKTTPKKYKVGRGDTLEEIAGRFGVSVSDLRKNNPGLTNKKLQAGQTLKIQK